MNKIKREFNWWILPAFICGLATIITVIAYLITLNLALILLILPLIAGTGFCLYRTFNIGNVQSEAISEGKPVIVDANSFCIYGEIINGRHFAKKVKFEKIEETEKLLGDRWYFEDLNKWLYVLFNDLADGNTWKAFELTDTQYTDPARLSIQLNMSRVNELFQIEPSLFDQLKPWLMFATITVVGFLIFLSGGG